MDKHLIVLDLDGTILSDLTTYDEETFDYLRKLNNDGHIIILATGRPKRSSYFVYEKLNLHTPLINYNGALVTNPKDPNYKVTDIRINRTDLLDIIENVRPYLINVFCEIHDDIYVMDYNENIHDFLHVDGGKLHTGELKNILPGNPNGALFFLDSNHIQEFEDYIKNKYHGHLLSRYWAVNNAHIVEIYNPLVDKKNGIKEAIDYYNINPKNTIAIGDGHNDLGLFSVVDKKIAMGNSHPELLKHATYVTDTIENQGALKYLKNYFKKKIG